MLLLLGKGLGRLIYNLSIFFREHFPTYLGLLCFFWIFQHPLRLKVAMVTHPKSTIWSEVPKSLYKSSRPVVVILRRGFLASRFLNFSCWLYKVAAYHNAGLPFSSWCLDHGDEFAWGNLHRVVKRFLFQILLRHHSHCTRVLHQLVILCLECRLPSIEVSTNCSKRHCMGLQH